MLQFCTDVHNTCNDSNTLVSPAPGYPTQPAKPPSVPQENPSKAEQELEKIKTAADDIKCDLITAPYFADCVQVGTNKIDVKEYKVDHDHVVGMSLQYGATTSRINHIQTETKPMEAMRYYDLLIHGYMRQIEHDLQLIPDDIKALCIAFHYKFLVYNEYCTVKYMKKFDAPRLLIQSCPSKQNDSRDIPFGGRLVSRVPINTNHKLKVKIQMGDTLNNCHLEDDEFVCVANNSYYASVTDELDLKEGDEYIIMQTTPSGWWYGVNDEGEDGWVPSNYLDRKDADHGEIIFGVTTHPDLFFNTPPMQHPFKHVGAAHVIYRASKSDVLIEVIRGKTQSKAHIMSPNCSATKGAFDIWIEDHVLRIGRVNGALLTKDKGVNILVNMDYYFAMAFTATDKKIISFEISGDFV
eukprot:497218_1